MWSKHSTIKARPSPSSKQVISPRVVSSLHTFYVQIGNGINSGLLWPTGQITDSNFNSASQLLHSAANAVRSVSSSTKIMVHLANGWDSSTMTWWLNGIQIPGAFSMSDVDILGFSFYPFYDTRATLAALKSSLTTVVKTYGKDVVIAETD